MKLQMELKRYGIAGVSAVLFFTLVEIPGLAAGKSAGPAAPATPASAYKDFSRYQPIIDRKPFGEPPVINTGPQPEPISPVTANYLSTLKLGYIGIVNGVVTRVTLIEGASVVPGKAPKNLTLEVGETEDGLTLVSADYENECVMVSKDGCAPQPVYMSAKKGAPAAVPGTRPPAIGANGFTAARSPVPVPSTDKPALSYLQRRKMAQDAADERLKKAAEEQAKIDPVALEKHLNNYQMDLIRAGGEKGPPLPIPLTEDMDNQLVSEGVLPPREAVAAPAPATPAAPATPEAPAAP